VLVHCDTPTLVRFEGKCVHHIRRPAGWPQVQDSAWNTGNPLLEGAGLVENYSASGAARCIPNDHENRHPTPRVKQALVRYSSSCYTYCAGDYDSASDEKSTQMSCEAPFGRSHRECHEHEKETRVYRVYIRCNWIAAPRSKSCLWIFKTATFPVETTTQLNSPRLMV
jgi:hypothetical protein